VQLHVVDFIRETDSLSNFSKHCFTRLPQLLVYVSGLGLRETACLWPVTSLALDALDSHRGLSCVVSVVESAATLGTS